MEEMSLLEQVAAQAAIRDTLYNYCRAVDRIDLNMLRAVFHPDATIDNGAYRGDVDGFVENVGTRHPTVSHAFHMIGNVMIDFLTPCKAFVETYAIALEQHEGEGPDYARIDRVYRVRYGDIFENREGWRVADRTLVIDHVQSTPVLTDLAPDLTGRYVGLRNAGDPLAVKRGSLLNPK